MGKLKRIDEKFERFVARVPVKLIEKLDGYLERFETWERPSRNMFIVHAIAEKLDRDIKKTDLRRLKKQGEEFTRFDVRVPVKLVEKLNRYLGSFETWERPSRNMFFVHAMIEKLDRDMPKED